MKTESLVALTLNGGTAEGFCPLCAELEETTISIQIF